eukprot:TRINITY_DN19501_c0_g1_i1.p3 TRINITY_DN19501_c0_g1~~TRINITY_DN19501_c0_g1_i1.p3  ORF type:complete len:137 (+),score=29.82 TRINITY_DN19501_c0_g1_i1:94-504(+)
MIRRPPRSTHCISSAASDVYKRQVSTQSTWENSYRVTYTWEQTTANDDQTTPVVKGLSLSAYPNPFQSHVDIQVNTKSNQPIQIEVFNIKGQSVYHAKAMPNTQITMDGKSLSSGIYFVKAKQGNETSVRKVLKLK